MTLQEPHRSGRLRTAGSTLATPSSALLHLLETRLDSIEKLEVVVLLHGAERGMLLHELAVRLQVGPDVLRRVIDDLMRTKLVEAAARDRYLLRAAGPELEAITEAGQLYEEDRVGTILLMSQIGRRRLRNLAARNVDALPARKKGDGGDHGA